MLTYHQLDGIVFVAFKIGFGQLGLATHTAIVAFLARKVHIPSNTAETKQQANPETW